MDNKALKRILKKFMQVTSREDLVGMIDTINGHIQEPGVVTQCHQMKEGLLDVLDNIDKMMTDLENAVELRDRSLAVSSREMTALNEEISAKNEKQKAVLDQLKSILELMQEKQKESADSSPEDLQILVQKVDRLVKTQLSLTKSLKLLFDEGLKVSSVLSFKTLESQFQESVRRLTGHPELESHIFFSGFLYGDQDRILFFGCDDKNMPVEKLDMNNEEQIKNSRFINIDSPKNSGTLAMIRMRGNMGVEQIDELLPQIQPLLPNVAATLENIRLLQEEKQKQRMEAELQTARFVQQTLLPINNHQVVSQIEVSGYYESASECGGDWWSHFEMKDGRQIVLLGDVTGHGTASAMICAVVKGYCDSFISRPDLSLSQMLAELNQVVHKIARDGSRAMTMIAVSVDMKNKKFTFANAGHPPPIMRRFAEAVTTNYLVNSGSILGIHGDSTYVEKTFDFNEGDQVILYSDGLTEYVGPESEMYGDSRLRWLLRKTKPTISSQELVRAIIQDVHNFAAGELAQDDITTVVIKNLGKSA